MYGYARYIAFKKDEWSDESYAYKIFEGEVGGGRDRWTGFGRYIEIADTTSNSSED